MAKRSDIKCAHCTGTMFDNRVYDDYNDPSKVICESCGGRSLDMGTTWVYNCKQCLADVDPGQLCGLFVPHLCAVCHNKELENDRIAGRICRMCQSPYSACAC